MKTAGSNRSNLNSYATAMPHSQCGAISPAWSRAFSERAREVEADENIRLPITGKDEA
jgi:hypothetical protein